VGLTDLLRKPFENLFAKSSREDQLAAYVIREHGLGRTIEDIMDDPYIRNRSTEDQRRRLLERPDVIQAVGDHLRGSPSES
jgi:hypothetical protein